MTIPINPVNIRPDVIIPPQQPDPIMQYILQGVDTFFRARQQRDQRSATSQEHEAQMAQVKIAQTREDRLNLEAKAAAEQKKAEGAALQLVLKHVLPVAEQSGHLNAMLGPVPQQQDQYGIPQNLPWNLQGGLPSIGASQGQSMPFIQAPRPPVNQTAPGANTEVADPFVALGQVLPTLPPDVIPGVIEHITPFLSMLDRTRAGGKGEQAIQTGDRVTTFVPGRGFYDPDANGGQGGYVKSIDRGLSEDQKAIKGLELELARERLQAMKDYRAEVNGRTMTRQFDSRTKDLRERGRVVMQAIKTISDAQSLPDPQKRVLTSSALANFVQAADQKVQLRYQILNYFKQNIDPSLVGRWEVFRDRLLKGSLPNYVMDAMLSHLNNLLAMSKSEFEKHREGEIKRHPELAGWLPEADEFFTSEMGPATKAGGLDQFIPPPPVP